MFREKILEKNKKNKKKKTEKKKKRLKFQKLAFLTSGINNNLGEHLPILSNWEWINDISQEAAF